MSASVAATLADYQSQVWRRDDGLPDNRIRAIIQTRDGYLWIGTESGLARFDGLQFTTFSRPNSPVFVSEDCTALTQDDEGSLWVGTARGLLRMKAGQFQRFTTQDGLNSDQVLSLASYGGSVWIMTSDGLNRFRGQSFEAVGPRSDAPEAGLFHVRMFHGDTAGNLWLSTVAGLRKFDNNTGEFVTVFRGGSWADALIAKSGDSLWFRRGRNLFTEHQDGTWIDHQSDAAASDFGTCMLGDRQGSLWIGSVENGLARYRDGQFQFYTRSNGLSDNWVLSLYEDREGHLWIGTGRGGLNRWTPRKFRSVTVEHGLPHENTWAVCNSTDGEGVWVGTDGGLCKWENERITTILAKTNGLFDPKIRAIATGRDGVVWIGTSLGLNKLKDGTITAFRFPAGVRFDKIRALLEDRSGTLWVGWEHGLARLANQEWSYFSRTNGGLSRNDVRALTEDRVGNLWIGTYGGGLNCWHKDGTRTIYSGEHGLTNEFVSVMYEDTEGVLWIGTERGLNRFKAGRFAVVNRSHGLFDDIINWLLEDKTGHFWISTDRGIYRVSKRDLNDVADGRSAFVQSLVFSEDDGLPSSETNGRKSHPAGCKTVNGQLWFPTTHGVAIIDPASLTELDRTPSVVIEQAQANHRVIFADGSATVQPARQKVSVAGITSPVTPQQNSSDTQIRLSPGSGQLVEFQYTANWFTAADKVRFKYRLLGSHDNWIDAGARRSSYYVNLRPGHYAFEVIACNHHGIWSKNGATLAFYLAPFFYQTWWFYGLCAAGLLLAGTLLYRRRVRELREMHALQAQTAISSELERVSHDLHDSLSGVLAWHVGCIEQAQNAAHATPSVRALLEPLAVSTREANQTLKEIVWVTEPKCNSLKNLIPYLCQYAGECLERAGIKARFDVPTALPEERLAPALRHHVFLTVKEALHNALRHSRATEVWLRVQKDKSYLRLSIEDNGRGFDLETGPHQSSSEGNGLHNMRRRISQCGGQLEMHSAPGKGTQIHIAVPLRFGSNTPKPEQNAS